MKERSYNTKERCKIFCYTPQLCDRTEKANINNNMPFIPFIEVNKESFGENFYMTDHAGSDLDKKASARKAVWKVAKILCEENKQRVITNMENVAKHLASDREFAICGEKFNDFTDSRLILDWFFSRKYQLYSLL